MLLQETPKLGKFSFLVMKKSGNFIFKQAGHPESSKLIVLFEIYTVNAIGNLASNTG